MAAEENATSKKALTLFQQQDKARAEVLKENKETLPFYMKNCFPPSREEDQHITFLLCSLLCFSGNRRRRNGSKILRRRSRRGRRRVRRWQWALLLPRLRSKQERWKARLQVHQVRERSRRGREREREKERKRKERKVTKKGKGKGELEGKVKGKPSAVILNCFFLLPLLLRLSSLNIISLISLSRSETYCCSNAACSFCFLFANIHFWR